MIALTEEPTQVVVEVLQVKVTPNLQLVGDSSTLTSDHE